MAIKSLCGLVDNIHGCFGLVDNLSMSYVNTAYDSLGLMFCFVCLKTFCKMEKMYYICRGKFRYSKNIEKIRFLLTLRLLRSKL